MKMNNKKNNKAPIKEEYQAQQIKTEQILLIKIERG